MIISDSKEGYSLQSDKDSFLYQHIEARNYCIYSENQKKDILSKTKRKIEEFKDTFMMLNGKDSEDSLFHSICYAICGHFMWTKNLGKFSNEELKSDLPVGFFRH